MSLVNMKEFMTLHFIIVVSIVFARGSTEFQNVATNRTDGEEYNQKVVDAKVPKTDNSKTEDFQAAAVANSAQKTHTDKQKEICYELSEIVSNQGNPQSDDKTDNTYEEINKNISVDNEERFDDTENKSIEEDKQGKPITQSTTSSEAATDSEEINGESDFTTESVRITHSDPEKSGTMENTFTNEEDKNVQHADSVKTKQSKHLKDSETTSPLTVTQAGSTNSQRSASIENKPANELTVTQAGSTSLQKIAQRIERGHAPKPATSDVVLINKNIEQQTIDRGHAPKPATSDAVLINKNIEQQTIERGHVPKPAANEVLISKHFDQQSSDRGHAPKSTDGTTVISDEETDQDDDVGTIQEGLIDRSHESSEDNSEEAESSMERKGRYVLSQIDGSKAIHKAIQMDMNYKTLLVDDGTGESKCYCSCSVNNRPVFFQMDPHSIQ